MAKRMPAPRESAAQTALRMAWNKGEMITLSQSSCAMIVRALEDYSASRQVQTLIDYFGDARNIVTVTIPR